MAARKVKRRRSKITAAQYKLLKRSTKDYLDDRGIQGVWYEHHVAARAALAEIDDLRALLVKPAAKPEAPFKRGDSVRYKKPSRARKATEHPSSPCITRVVGTITSRPRIGSNIAHVQWPNGWAGYVFLDDMERVV